MNYEHIVYIKYENGKVLLCIDRLFENGKRDFVMQAEVPEKLETEEALWNEFEKLGEWLGKSICIDLPDLRRALGIEEK